MKIYIELVIIIALMLVFILWKIWFDISKRRALKKYDESKNECGKPGDFNPGSSRSGRTENSEPSSCRTSQPEGRSLLPTTEAVSDGKTESVIGEDKRRDKKGYSGIRKLFSRRRTKG
jgi:hypothetical protein